MYAVPTALSSTTCTQLRVLVMIECDRFEALQVLQDTHLSRDSIAKRAKIKYFIERAPTPAQQVRGECPGKQPAQPALAQAITRAVAIPRPRST